MPASLLVAQASPTVDALHISGDSAGVADQQVNAGIHSQEAQADPNPLSTYPRCKHLIEVYRALPGAQNKTPLAVLHEYATRLNLEVRSVGPDTSREVLHSQTFKTCPNFTIPFAPGL